jgi:hypothetical protein
MTLVDASPKLMLTVMFGGHVMIGEMTSATATVKEHFLDRSTLLNAVQVTEVLIATGNKLPEAGEQVILAIPELSDALAV